LGAFGWDEAILNGRRGGFRSGFFRVWWKVVFAGVFAKTWCHAWCFRGGFVVSAWWNAWSMCKVLAGRKSCQLFEVYFQGA